MAKPPVAISGATASTYTAGSADVGELLSVKETTVSATYASASVLAPAGTGTTSQLLVTTPATAAIHGIGAQGQVLSAVVGAWPTAGVVTSYHWLDCPATSTCNSADTSTYLPISGATKSMLTVLASYGQVALRVTGTKAGYASASVTSDAASLVPATTVVTLSAPAIAGTSAGAAHVGAKLTAVTGKFSVAGLTDHYVWQVQECVPSSCDPSLWTQQASGAGSSTSSYVPTVADLGGGDWSIRVEETVVRTGYDPTPDDSSPVAIAPGSIAVTKAPALTSTTASFGVTAGAYSPVGGTTTVQLVHRWLCRSRRQHVFPQFGDGRRQGHLRRITYSVAGYADAVRQVIAQRGTQATPTPETVTGAAFGDTLQASTANPFADAAGTTILRRTSGTRTTPRSRAQRR